MNVVDLIKGVKLIEDTEKPEKDVKIIQAEFVK